MTHSGVQGKSGDQVVLASSIINQQLHTLYLQQKEDLKKSIVAAIAPKGFRQKHVVNRAVNAIVGYPGFQVYFKLMILHQLQQDYLAKHPQLGQQNGGKLESSHEIATKKSKQLRFGGPLDWFVDRKKVVADSTNEALTLATTDKRKKEHTDYLSDVMYGAYAKTKGRIAEDVKQYCADNAIPLGLLAAGTMLPGTLGQIVAAGGLQALLPTDSESLTNIGLGSALMAAGGYLDSGWLSGVLAGTGLLQANSGIIRALPQDSIQKNFLILNTVFAQPVLGWFMPEGAAAKALLVGGLSVWPLLVGEELRDRLNKK